MEARESIDLVEKDWQDMKAEAKKVAKEEIKKAPGYEKKDPAKMEAALDALLEDTIDHMQNMIEENPETPGAKGIIALQGNMDKLKVVITNPPNEMKPGLDIETSDLEGFSIAFEQVE